MLLALAMSSATVVIATKNSSRSTEKSIIAFQIADGAAENILKRIYKDSDSNLDDLADNLFHSGANPTCANGVISGVLPSSSGTYAVTVLKNDSTTVSCSDGAWRGLVVRLKASGTFSGTTRSIDVGVEP